MTHLPTFSQAESVDATADFFFFMAPTASTPLAQVKYAANFLTSSRLPVKTAQRCVCRENAWLEVLDQPWCDKLASAPSRVLSPEEGFGVIWFPRANPIRKNRKCHWKNSNSPAVWNSTAIRSELCNHLPSNGWQWKKPWRALGETKLISISFKSIWPSKIAR